MPRHEARGAGSQENGGAAYLIWLAEAAHRRAHQQLTATVGTIEQTFVQRSAKDARQNRVHADTIWRPLDGERFGKRRDSRFARAVGRDFLQRNERCQRPNVDDATVAFLDHAGSKCATRPQHPGQIRVHDLVPFGIAHFYRRTANSDTGRVDEDVNLIELLDDRLRQLTDRLCIADVSRQNERSTPCSFNFPRRLLDKFFAATSWNYCSTGLRKGERDRPADARRGTDYHCDAAGQVKARI